MRKLLCVFVTLLVVARTGSSQTVNPIKETLIGDTPRCAQCGIAVETRMTFGGEESPLSVQGLPTAVRKDARGRYWLLGKGTPRVFGADGRRIDSSFAGGEALKRFVYPQDAVAIGDSMLVLDGAGGRATLIGPHLTHVRDVAFDYPFARVGVLKWPTCAVGSGIVSTAESAGYPLHPVSFSGDAKIVGASFGSGSGELFVGRDAELSERIVHTTESGFWTSKRYEYALTHWNVDLQRDVVLRRVASWLGKTSQPSIGDHRTPPSPSVTAASVDEKGLLWVFVAVPADRWREAWPPVRSGLYEMPVSAIAMDKLYKTVIEVIDLDRGQLVARKSTSVLVIDALPGREAVITKRSKSGALVISVVGLTLSDL